MIVLRKTLTNALAAAALMAESDRTRLTRMHLAAVADAAEWQQRAESAEAERDQWKAAAEGADPAAGRAGKRYASLVAAIKDGLDTAPQCSHRPWPCTRENCSRGRYAAGLARALELAGTGGQDGSEDEGPEAGGES